MIDLQFKDVSKKYLVRREAEPDADAHPLVRKLRALRLRRQEFWAVSNVSFEVPHGEALGIIGHNGAGKSTILKLLSNITTPTSGEIMINGRLSALIEVGSGFHPELTGRENIYLNGSILGMGRREIAEKLDSIVDFAGIRQFVDTPVKRYSSGMYVRLGFSIAAHLDPDILLLDEVLAVGDAAFQAKCLQRINELRQVGTTIVFISHDLGAVERVCDRVLLMQRGEIAASGSPSEVIAEYQRPAAGLAPPAPQEEGGAGSSKKAEVASFAFYDSEGYETSALRTGDPVIARINYRVREPVTDAAFEIFFFSHDGDLHCHLTTELDDELIDLDLGTGTVEFFASELGLLPGVYNIGVTIKHRGGPMGGDIDWRPHCAILRVDPGKMVRGNFYMPHQWRHVYGGNGDNEADAEQEFSEVSSPKAF